MLYYYVDSTPQNHIHVSSLCLDDPMGLSLFSTLVLDCENPASNLLL